MLAFIIRQKKDNDICTFGEDLLSLFPDLKER